MGKEDYENKHSNIIFFKFHLEDTKDSLVERLKEVKAKGFYDILASYQLPGLKEGHFTDAYYKVLPYIADACMELGMSFWLEDYSPFPTGSANGAFKKEENAHLNKLFVDERHMDFRGPLKNVLINIDALQKVTYGNALRKFSKIDIDGRKRISVVAYRIIENDEIASPIVLEDESAVLLDENIENGMLKWNIPDGYWRIFVIFSTYESAGRANYMNLLSKDSVALEIAEVHEPIYRCLKDYIGKSWSGFFYDEPEIGNDGGDGSFDYYMLPGRRTIDPSDINTFPWSSEMSYEMEQRYRGWIRELPFIWYDGKELHKQLRLNYMNAITLLVQNNHNGQVYDFCKKRGIGYICHVLEDEGSHCRLGCGPGHYFRQQYYQDEAGIDVIAGQILPGRDGVCSWYGSINADGRFYHYGLAKLASSEAHINPLKKGKSFCETFAMYGQLGYKERKFLIDHLLVNGINRILFADMPSYQSSEEYPKYLSEYTDKMCEILRNSKPVTKVAILYEAETQWTYGKNTQGFHIAGAELARNQISYDVIPTDVFLYPDKYNCDFSKGLNVNSNC